MYLSMVALLTLPAVLQKYERVHIDGIFISGSGNSFLNSLADRPLILNIMSAGEIVGGQFKNKCT